MPAHLQHVLTSVITEALSDMRRPQPTPSAPQILSAEMSPYLLAAEADCRPDPGTSRHNPMGIRGCRLTRTSNAFRQSSTSMVHAAEPGLALPGVPGQRTSSKSCPFTPTVRNRGPSGRSGERRVGEECM